jgi:hypothetical protein
MNQIFRLIDTFPKKPWQWPCICSRDDITFAFVLAHLDKYPWAWIDLSANPHIGSWKNVQAHPELPWVFHALANNPNVPLSVVLADPVRFDILKTRINQGCLERNDYTVTMAIANPHICVDWTEMSQHPSLTFENVKNILRLRLTWDIDWAYISSHNNITIRDFIEAVEFDVAVRIDWDVYAFMANPNVYIEDVLFLRPRLQAAGFNEDDIYTAFSQNPNLCLHYAIANRHLPWDWSDITLHKDVTIDLITMSPPDIPWCRYNLSRNRTLTVDFIKRYGRAENIYLDWDPYVLSQNPAITLKHVLDNPVYLRWAFRSAGLGINPSIPPSQVLADCCLWIKIDRGILHKNPMLTIEDVLMYPTYEWNWLELSRTPFTATAKLMLQRWWKFRGKLTIRCRKRAALTAIEAIVGCAYLSKHIVSYIG